MAPVYAKRYVGREEKLFAELSKRYGSDCVSRLSSKFNDMVAMHSGEETRVRRSDRGEPAASIYQPNKRYLNTNLSRRRANAAPVSFPEAVVSRCFPQSSSTKPFSMSAAAFAEAPESDETAKNGYPGEAFAAVDPPAPPKGSPSPRKRLTEGLPPPHPATSSLALKRREQHFQASGSPRLRSRTGNSVVARTPVTNLPQGTPCAGPMDEKHSPICSPTSMSSTGIKSPSSKSSPRSTIVPVSLESLLRDFYRKHQPDKLQLVPTVANEYRGNERELIRLLRSKYGALSVKRA
ncbi:hypothetical protein PINS_up021226 [Pythium insidiosum]|nr:hypothetical protein PINS_up021226 [Pythium insidiosum]